MVHGHSFGCTMPNRIESGGETHSTVDISATRMPSGPQFEVVRDKNEGSWVPIGQFSLFQTESVDPLHSRFSPFYRSLSRQMTNNLWVRASQFAARMLDDFQKIVFIVNLETPEKPPLFH